MHRTRMPSGISAHRCSLRMVAGMQNVNPTQHRRYWPVIWAGWAAVLIAVAAMAGCIDKKIKLSLTPPSPRESLVSALKNDDPDRRYQALSRLSKSKAIHEDWAIKGLVLIAQTDPVAQVRALAVRTFGPIADNRVVRQTVTSLADRDDRVRTEAAWVLRQIPYEVIEKAGQADTAKTALLKTLADDHSVDVRINSAIALAGFSDRKVLSALITALRDPDFAVAYHAEKSLVCLTGRTFRGSAPAWIRWLRATEAPFEHAGKTPPELVRRKQHPWETARDRIHQWYADWQGPTKQ